jgi:hypothetical protein
MVWVAAGAVEVVLGCGCCPRHKGARERINIDKRGMPEDTNCGEGFIFVPGHVYLRSSCLGV